jgi:hypothetical protein
MLEEDRVVKNGYPLFMTSNRTAFGLAIVDTAIAFYGNFFSSM